MEQNREEINEINVINVINVIIIGEVDSGKSTTLGHLCYLSGNDSEWKEKVNTMREGKKYFNFAMQTNEYLRANENALANSLTINTNNFLLKFSKLPGIRRFYHSENKCDVKNYNLFVNSLGVKRNIGLVVISAALGEFEMALSQYGKTREEILFLKRQGISHLIISINKMDERGVNYSQEKFNEIKKEYSVFLKKHFKEENFFFVPISAFYGENLTEISQQMTWYNGPTLIDTFDLIPLLPHSDQPLRIYINDYFNVHNIGSVILGEIGSGQLSVGDEIIFAPSKARGIVLSIVKDKNNLEKAIKGDVIAFNVNLDQDIIINRGSVAGDLQFEVPNDDEVKYFQAIIDIVDQVEIREGFIATLHRGNIKVECQFNKLISKLARNTNREIEKDPLLLKKGDYAIVELIPSSSLVVETVDDFPFLARFTLRNHNHNRDQTNQLIGFGSVIMVGHRSGLFTKSALKPNPSLYHP